MKVAENCIGVINPCSGNLSHPLLFVICPSVAYFPPTFLLDDNIGGDCCYARPSTTRPHHDLAAISTGRSYPAPHLATRHLAGLRTGTIVSNRFFSTVAGLRDILSRHPKGKLSSLQA